MSKILTRDQVSEDLKWDLTSIFETEEDYENAIKEINVKSEDIVSNYKGKLSDKDTILKCIKDLEDISIISYHALTYSSLCISVDETNTKNQERSMKASMTFSELMAKLSFINSELKRVDYKILDEAIESTSKYKVFLEDIKASKKYELHPEVEKTLANLSPVLEAPYQIYNKAKLADLSFDDFEVDGTTYPLSFVLFENEYQAHPDKNIRRKAFEEFSRQLVKYKNTIGTAYSTKLQEEKIMSNMRGYENIFEYLLFDQKVDIDLYNRQIDLIMEKLAPHMQKYARLIKKAHKLEEMTFADLKISLDPEYDPRVSIEESKEYVKGSLSILGEDYLNLVLRAYDERWIDFADNKGKSTGGFCASPYGKNSFILLSWTGAMSEVFTLVHELGHAGHFMSTHENNSLFSSRPSTYFVEAPSTINELFLTNYLIKKSDDKRFKRWVLSSMVANTYYHNCVTHLLEAAYQREVYKLVEQGQGVHAEVFSKLKREVLEKFWGDAVDINDGAELTWMRQPHYYMGLYPYTYSAGLTIATAVNKRILEEGEPAINDWLNTIKAGGSKDPIGLAKMAGIDITTEKPLLDTIDYIGELIDEIEKLTDEIEN